MNSLNFVAGRVSPQTTPAPSRSNSYGNALSLAGAADISRKASKGNIFIEKEDLVQEVAEELPEEEPFNDGPNEKTPLLQHGEPGPQDLKPSSWYLIPSRIAGTLFISLRWVVSTLAAPGVYLIACLYDENGRFAPFRKLWRGDAPIHEQVARAEMINNGTRRRSRQSESIRVKTPYNANSSSSGLSSESESDRDLAIGSTRSSQSARHSRSKSTAESSEEIAPARRSIRIKLHADDSLRQRKSRKSTQLAASQSNGTGGISSTEISPALLKSPTSPAASLLLTKYPRAPGPPRPLIPRRQPSYTQADLGNGVRLAQKTLILDLDETLIHSMAKGGRMSTGHMVEVKLNTVIGASGQASIGPQHPILYYVHKRPFCDEFLRRVCKWYNLVIFTASVQEYADPVIDWLEQERKFFTARYYRQHCTFRNGAFIKDLSSVEPDLSKVMILDNSPLSYMFHQDNAIPIEGWINDPTDNDLLHLVPMFEALQFAVDVRSILALRGGEDGKHMIA